ncbi:hypothetical protein BaRGS_00032885, partial [Batillaria attramentaria]
RLSRALTREKTLPAGQLSASCSVGADQFPAEFLALNSAAALRNMALRPFASRVSRQLELSQLDLSLLDAIPVRLVPVPRRPS